MRIVAVLLLGMMGALFNDAMAQPSEALIDYFVQKRKSLVQESAARLPELSIAIRQAVAEGEKLERQGLYQKALDELLKLERFMPVSEIPSFDVQMLASWLHGKLGDKAKSTDHQARAAVLRELLLKRIGSGATPDTAVQAIMNSDVAEWAKMQLAIIKEVKVVPEAGREYLRITYQGPLTRNEPKEAWFEIDPRVRVAANRAIDRYQPIPVAQMRPEDLRWLQLAREKRDRFLDDKSFKYLELIAAMRDLLKQAAELDMQGKSSDALKKLREIEAHRPIAEIPTPRFLSFYSFLLGRTGDRQGQLDMRGLIFGIQQVIAHSGDGSTEKSAVHVLSTEEEYDWLNEKKLKLVRQSLVERDGERFDLMAVTDAAGGKREVYFNISRMFAKYGQ